MMIKMESASGGGLCKKGLVTSDTGTVDCGFAPNHVVIVWFNQSNYPTYCPTVSSNDNGTYECYIPNYSGSQNYGSITLTSSGFSYAAYASAWCGSGSYYIAWRD